MMKHPRLSASDCLAIPDEAIVRLDLRADKISCRRTLGHPGPDSEIYYDRGVQYGCGEADCKPGCECERFLEI